MANPVFAEITAQPAAMFPTDTGERPLVNQDELLVRYPGAIGGKTGYTDAARKTFVGAADRGGRRLVIAMMYGLVREGGPTYWDQAAMLLDWGFAQNPSESVATLLVVAAAPTVRVEPGHGGLRLRDAGRRTGEVVLAWPRWPRRSRSASWGPAQGAAAAGTRTEALREDRGSAALVR